MQIQYAHHLQCSLDDILKPQRARFVSFVSDLAAICIAYVFRSIGET